jgi:zinc-ribbon domain
VRFCPNCGTEVDESAAFCPTCGQAIDQAAESEIPAAPAWPDATGQPVASLASEPVPSADPDVTQGRPIPADAAAPPPPPAPAESSGPTVELPLTMPVTLSGWLIGIGALIGSLGVLIGLFDGPVNLLEIVLLVALVGIAVTVFFSDMVGNLPNLRLATLVVSLVAFGTALDRLFFGGAGAGELLLFLGAAAAAMGAVILELGRDQPLGPAR